MERCKFHFFLSVVNSSRGWIAKNGSGVRFSSSCLFDRPPSLMAACPSAVYLQHPFCLRNVRNRNSEEITVYCGFHQFLRLNISCQYVHFTSIEDIYSKSSIPGQSSILRVKESSENGLRSTPTYLQWHVNLDGDDYRVEVNKKGRNITDPALGF